VCVCVCWGGGSFFSDAPFVAYASAIATRLARATFCPTSRHDRWRVTCFCSTAARTSPSFCETSTTRTTFTARLRISRCKTRPRTARLMARSTLSRRHRESAFGHLNRNHPSSPLSSCITTVLCQYPSLSPPFIAATLHHTRVRGCTRTHSARTHTHTHTHTHCVTSASMNASTSLRIARH
jgi:hypothetical protein